jgi:uncharacterized membrane protein
MVAISIIGARLQITAISYLLVGAVILAGFLVAKNIIKGKYYSLYILAIALCTFLQISLLGQHVVGGDVHSEFYISSLTMQNGWDLSYSQQYNSSIVVAVIAPFLAKFMDLIWVYKIIFPICLAFVPFIMYYVFKKQMGELKAFWATMFFMIVPIMSLEIIGIAKASVAELFFALFIFVMVYNIRFKYIVLPVLVILTLMAHYTVGILLLGYLFVCIVLLIIAKIRKIKSKVGLIVLCSTFIISASGGYIYYKNTTAGGVIISIVADGLVINDNPVAVDSGDVINTAMIEDIINKQSDLVKIGVGLDMSTASPSGKVFRIIQYVTQIMLVLGLIQLWRKRKTYKFTPEFIALILAGFGSIGLAMIMPSFSDMINITRIYQLSLFFIAPLFVLGCEMVCNKKWFIPIILVAYFIFTSGLIFELSRSNSIDKLDIPYSIPLSYERTGVVSVVNQDDINCAIWLSQNGDCKIMSGYNTSYLLVCYMGDSDRVLDLDVYMPFGLDDNYKGYYFISSWEAERNKTTSYINIGLREIVPIPDNVGSLPIIYKSGNSVVRER